MFHLIDINLQAYRRAVADTAKARAIFQLNPHSKNNDSLVSCQEEEQRAYDGVTSIIVMAIKEAAMASPHNPFSINGDVNQPDTPNIPPVRNGPPPRED